MEHLIATVKSDVKENPEYAEVAEVRRLWI